MGFTQSSSIILQHIGLLCPFVCSYPQCVCVRLCPGVSMFVCVLHIVSESMWVENISLCISTYISSFFSSFFSFPLKEQH